MLWASGRPACTRTARQPGAPARRRPSTSRLWRARPPQALPQAPPPHSRSAQAPPQGPLRGPLLMRARPPQGPLAQSRLGRGRLLQGPQARRLQGPRGQGPMRQVALFRALRRARLGPLGLQGFLRCGRPPARSPRLAGRRRRGRRMRSGRPTRPRRPGWGTRGKYIGEAAGRGGACAWAAPHAPDKAAGTSAACSWGARQARNGCVWAT